MPRVGVSGSEGWAWTWHFEIFYDRSVSAACLQSILGENASNIVKTVKSKDETKAKCRFGAPSDKGEVSGQELQCGEPCLVNSHDHPPSTIHHRHFASRLLLPTSLHLGFTWGIFVFCGTTVSALDAQC